MTRSVIRRFYACQHKNIRRTFIITNGVYFEERPSCVEKGCNGYEMVRVESPNANKVELIEIPLLLNEPKYFDDVKHH